MYAENQLKFDSLALIFLDKIDAALTSNNLKEVRSNYADYQELLYQIISIDEVRKKISEPVAVSYRKRKRIYNKK